MPPAVGADEEHELHRWLATEPGVVVSSHGGAYPEQWEGTTETLSGGVIAAGATCVDGYGETVTQRAQFIVDIGPHS
jgi:hypothetical protein